MLLCRNPWLLVSAALVALLGSSACKKSGICGKSDLIVDVLANHGHDERLPAAEVVKGAGRYRVGAGSHEHGFTLTEEHVKKLRAGESIELRSTSMNAHLHELRLKCER